MTYPLGTSHSLILERYQIFTWQVSRVTDCNQKADYPSKPAVSHYQYWLINHPSRIFGKVHLLLILSLPNEHELHEILTQWQELSVIFRIF
jgi:hypothetical protein